MADQRQQLALNPGDLRHAITIQAPSTAAGSFGASVGPASWTAVRSTMAAIYTAGGRDVAGFAARL